MAILSDAVLKPHLGLINDKLPLFPRKACKVSFQKSPFVSTYLYTPGWRSLVASALPDKNNGQENESHGAKHKQSSSHDVVTTVEKPAEDTTILGLKKALIDSAFSTERGLVASSEVRAEVIELINQLEAKNPTPAPTDALQLLNGKWILIYTSWSELFPLLAAGILPLVKVGEISQTIDAEAFSAQNSVTFFGPYASTSFSTTASFEVRSPQRVQIKFEEGIIGTPQLIDSIVVPEHFVLMGQKIDLSPIQGILRPLQEAASSVAKSLNERPPLKFPIQTESAQSWLLTTYLDHDLRISRGDRGSVFILLKEGSQLLNT